MSIPPVYLSVRHFCVSRSSLRHDLIKWVECPSVCWQLFFSISSLITWPTKLKLCRVLLDIVAHSRSVPHFAISSQGARLLKSSISISSRITCNLIISLCLFSTPSTWMKNVRFYISGSHRGLTTKRPTRQNNCWTWSVRWRWNDLSQADGTNLKVQ